MKLLFLGTVLAFTSCFSSDQIAATASTRGTDKSSTVVIEKWTLTLHNESGKCVLFSQSSGQKSTESTAPLDMAAPCEFIRRRENPDQPLYYTYGKGDKAINVAIITGGEPDKELKDALQPGGCGTSIIKIKLHSDRIDTNERSEHVGAICATSGLEEKWFAFLNIDWKKLNLPWSRITWPGTTTREI
jgi:hypothetical protein